MRVPASIVRLAFAASCGFGCVVWLRSIGGPAGLRDWGGWAPAVSLSLHVAVEMIPIGNLIPFGIANGALYGPWEGALLSWIGWMAAAVIQWALVRGNSSGSAAPLPLPHRARWFVHLAVDYPAVLILGRWLPGGAYFLNVTASVLEVSLARQLTYAGLASIPPALLLSRLGARLAAG